MRFFVPSDQRPDEKRRRNKIPGRSASVSLLEKPSFF